VLEITEHEAIGAYEPLRAASARLGTDVRFAVDDAGAGVANFNHLVGLRPDFVKIDASLIRGVDTDLSRAALVVGLVHFAAAAGCQVIAEGIETEAEGATVAGLGVLLGQGFLLGRPAEAATWRSTRQPRSNQEKRPSPARRTRRGPAIPRSASAASSG
jgi:EAL domain-containing protein (putative c-di-GMP-specific phosphodiesterase class I)